jgi:hypothetical protein
VVAELITRMAPSVLPAVQEEALDAVGDLFAVGLEREVPCVEQMGFHLGG